MRERRIRRHALKHEAAPKESDESTTVMTALGILIILAVVTGLSLEIMGASF
jgi:hypothetical protein